MKKFMKIYLIIGLVNAACSLVLPEQAFCDAADEANYVFGIKVDNSQLGHKAKWHWAWKIWQVIGWLPANIFELVILICAALKRKKEKA